MKKLSATISTLLILALMASTTFAKENPAEKKNKLDVSKMEINLLNGVASGNHGLKVSSVHQLGEIKSSKAVIPLMKILHNEKDEAARITAALALYKIGDARGIYAVKQAAKYDKSERVRKICAKVYSEYADTVKL